MSILNGFFLGIKTYGCAWRILFRPSFRKFLLFPLLATVLLFGLGHWLAGLAGDSLAALLQEKLTVWLGEVSWLEGVGSAAGFVLRLLFKIFYFFLFVSFGGYLVLVVLSPVYSRLSEKTEALLTGKVYPFSFKQLMWEISRGVLIVIRNMIFQALIVIGVFFLSFIPVVGLVSPLFLFLTSAYFYGFSFVDYAVERKRFNVKESVRYINKNVGMVTGIGAVFALSLLIPWLSIVACGFVSLLSVIAGTVALNSREPALPAVF